MPNVEATDAARLYPHKRGQTTTFRLATSNTGYPAYAISFSHRYLKFALLRSTGKKGEK